ncbi:transketolase family protein [Amycolatopsis magusensis]|uniref:Transketolase n=1 Tax=Amycolatopsis magusensis TaxID=882444 RepID=A0ABS4PZL7_9PSEU|nr:transketolase C-terminal domain-containing protein [Amycolatopsis magusensis]MBP2184866.1 transketolase [Amycolatopsis magusensis]
MALTEWYADYGLSSRTTARRAQLELAREDDRIFSVENDLGLPAVPFDKEFPDRYLQVGIAEADQIGIAAGMAVRGKIPFVNTFAVFGTMRACEQLRLDVCYNGAPVKVVGYYTGLSGGYAGPSHQCVEDIALTTAMPGMTVLSPADAYETYLAVRAAAAHPGPVYLRASRGPTPAVYGAYRSPVEFRIGEAVVLRDNGDTGEATADVSILATGCQIVPMALEAAELLADNGIRARVVNVHTLKPLDRAAILAEARRSRLLVTYEDHNRVGGLGSLVAATVLGAHPVPVLSFGVPDQYCAQTAEYDEMLVRYGLGPAQVTTAVLRWLSQH